MKIKQRGHIFETNNPFAIEQLLKYGGEEVKAEPKKVAKKPVKKEQED